MTKEPLHYLSYLIDDAGYDESLCRKTDGIIEGMEREELGILENIRDRILGISDFLGGLYRI